MPVATKLKKATFKHIESELYSYHDTLKEIQFMRQNMIFTRDNNDENVGGGRSSIPYSPTEAIATRLATHKKLAQLEEVTNAIEKVYTSLPEEYRNLVRLKYWTKPQLKTWEGIANEMHVNRATAIRWRNSIILSISETLGWR